MVKDGMKIITMNSKMVAAILSGRQTKIRRAVRPRGRRGETGIRVEEQDGHRVAMAINQTGEVVRIVSPPYKTGTVLGIQESFAKLGVKGKWSRYVYKATDVYPFGFPRFRNFRWRIASKMPYEAMRLFLKVTNVQIGRINDMEPEDYRAEGYDPDTLDGVEKTIEQYKHDWDLAIKPAERETFGYDAAPWCYIYEIEVISKKEAEGE